MSFEDHLHLVENEFLSALTQGEEAIAAFNARWENLLEEVNAALDANLLDEATSILAHATALRIATLAETSASLFTSCDNLTVQFMDEIASLMSELDMSDHPQSDSGTLPLSPFPSLDSPPPRNTCGTKRTRRDVETPSPCKRRRRSPSKPTNDSKVAPVWRTATMDPPRISSLNTACLPKLCEFDVVPYSRKRRLSEAAIDAIPSPSKCLYIGPRLHSVSDSFICRSTPSCIPSSSSCISAHDFVPASDTPTLEPVRGHCSNHSSQIESLEGHILALPQSSMPWSGNLSTFVDVWPSLDSPTIFDDCHSPLTHSDEVVSVPLSGLEDKTTSSAHSSPYPPTPPALNSGIDPPHYCSMPLSSVGVADAGLNPDWIGFDIPPPSFGEGLDPTPLDTWSSTLGIWDPSVWLAIPPPPYQLSSSAGFTLTKLTPSSSSDLTSLPDFGDSGTVDLDALDCGIRNGASLAALA